METRNKKSGGITIKQGYGKFGHNKSSSPRAPSVNDGRDRIAKSGAQPASGVRQGCP